MPMSQYPTPSLVKILFALFYDLIIVLGLFMITGFVVLPIHQLITGEESISAGSIYFPVLLYLVLMFYVCGSWRFGGQTIGMKAWKFRLVSVNDQEDLTAPSYQQLCQRFFLAHLSLLLCGIGYWMALWSKPPRLLHDRLTNTQLMLIKR
jgi:uncharacterized RDD family membrane protein YckC